MFGTFDRPEWLGLYIWGKLTCLDQRLFRPVFDGAIGRVTRKDPTVFDHCLYTSPMERTDVVQSEHLSLILCGLFGSGELGLVGLGLEEDIKAVHWVYAVSARSKSVC